MIQRLAICVCTMLFVAMVVSSQEQVRELPPLPKGVVNVGDPAKIKAVLAREEEMRQAYIKLDAKLVADFYAEDYLTLTMGAWCCVATKAAQIQGVIEHRDAKSPFPITSMKSERTVVRVHGNVAVVTGVDVIDVMFTEEKPPRPERTRILYMNVWELIKGKWLLIGGSHKLL